MKTSTVLFFFLVLYILVLTESTTCAQSPQPPWKSASLPPGGMSVLFSSGDTLYAGTEGSGVYRTDDIGQTWAPSNVGIENLIVRAFTAIGDAWFIGTDKGVYRSNDQGKSWVEASSGLPPSGARSVLAIAASGTTLFAGVAAVFRSTDLGQNWIEVKEGLPTTGACSADHCRHHDPSAP